MNQTIEFERSMAKGNVEIEPKVPLVRALKTVGMPAAFMHSPAKVAKFGVIVNANESLIAFHLSGTSRSWSSFGMMLSER